MSSANTEFSGTVLISGGASGIGRSIAESFLAAGAPVHICDASQDNIDDFLEANSGASATQADVSNADQVDQAFSDLETRYDSLDVLVNNAGIAGPTAAVEDITIDEWNQCIAVDLSGTFYMTRRAVPLLKQRQAGSIINIASVAGLFGCPLRSPYAASKWAMIGLTRTWAMELGPYNIRVNSVMPGYIWGPMVKSHFEARAKDEGKTFDEVYAEIADQLALPRIPDSEEIAGSVLFFASDLSSCVTGQSLDVNGGQVMY